MVQYLHFRILKFPLTFHDFSDGFPAWKLQMCACFKFHAHRNALLFKRVQPFLYCSKPLWGYCWGSSLHPIIFWGWGRFALCTCPCSFFTLIRSHIHHPNFLINMARPKRSWIALLLGTSNIFQHCVWNLSELYLGIFGPLPETAWAKAASQASNFQDSTLTFARLGASQSIDVGLDVGQVASLPSSSVSSKRSSEVSLGCCIFPIRIAVVDGHPMVPSGNQTVTLLAGKFLMYRWFSNKPSIYRQFPIAMFDDRRASPCSDTPMYPQLNLTWGCTFRWKSRRTSPCLSPWSTWFLRSAWETETLVLQIWSWRYGNDMK